MTVDDSHMVDHRIFPLTTNVIPTDRQTTNCNKNRRWTICGTAGRPSRYAFFLHIQLLYIGIYFFNRYIQLLCIRKNTPTPTGHSFIHVHHPAQPPPPQRLLLLLDVRHGLKQQDRAFLQRLYDPSPPPVENDDDDDEAPSVVWDSEAAEGQQQEEEAAAAGGGEEEHEEEPAAPLLPPFHPPKLQVVFTKCDLLPRDELARRILLTRRELEEDMGLGLGLGQQGLMALPRAAVAGLPSLMVAAARGRKGLAELQVRMYVWRLCVRACFFLFVCVWWWWWWWGNTVFFGLESLFLGGVCACLPPSHLFFAVCTRAHGTQKAELAALLPRQPPHPHAAAPAAAGAGAPRQQTSGKRPPIGRGRGGIGGSSSAGGARWQGERRRGGGRGERGGDGRGRGQQEQRQQRPR